jgi:hypothetical protein
MSIQRYILIELSIQAQLADDLQAEIADTRALPCFSASS